MRVYLSGEIHSDWRDEIIAACGDLELVFDGPVTNHAASDDCGVAILGVEAEKFWHDRKGAQLNAIRTRNGLEQADIIVVRFGEKYKQWNAAFDAGFCAALGTPYITLHDDDIIHPLKEVDGAAMAWAQTPEQVVEVLKYVTNIS